MGLRNAVRNAWQAQQTRMQERAEQRYQNEWGISPTRSKEIADVQARYAAQCDRKEMEARERQLSEGKLPVDRIGTAYVKDGQLHMSGWQFEGGEEKEIESGTDIKEATGWSAQELADMARAEFTTNAEYRHEVMNGTRNEPAAPSADKEAGE